MKATDLSEILARVESATGPDRELDWSIQLDVVGRVIAPLYGQHPAFTTSLDAALALVERFLPERDDAYLTMRAALLDKRLFGNRMSEALPLALLAALLKSLIEAPE